ncbi:helix-turn-helix transcriptional regulator [Nocardia wallacei]|uniref:helix-turn-helix transcriptional regulator n=1 Tax=Nocardia wallacei TaxID=480035 RepID=UPI00245462C2|nr:helix-turn-helix transcriptional regulator [Nocardia wallacei]
MLYGRDETRRRISKLLDEVQAGRGATLFIIGGPGLGKTALLDLSLGMIEGDWTTLSCKGVEPEATLSFAGLHQLLTSVPDVAPRLPEARQKALTTALDGLRTGSSENCHQVGLATLSLLTELSALTPVLCLVDDVHWWDQQSFDALSFAVRRLGRHRVAVLLAGRVDSYPVHSMPTISLTPLDMDDSRTLLTTRLPQLPSDLRERVLVTAAGNPQALLELPTVNGELPVIEPLVLPDRLQIEYQREIAVLPEVTRMALLVVAADSTESLIVVVRVLIELGLTAAALDAAERSGIVIISGYRIAFRHPLERAAAYRIAPFSLRLAVHAAIAAATSDRPEERAWHLAAAATTTDESAAAALEGVAHRMQYPRAGVAAERAARLSPQPGDRRRRLLLALESMVEAGETQRASTLADEIAGSVDMSSAELAQLAAAQGRILSVRGPARAAYDQYTDAAARLSSTDPVAAARMLLHAASAVWLGKEPSLLSRARAAVANLGLDAERCGLLDIVDGQIALRSQQGGRAELVRLARKNIRHGRAYCADDLSIQFTLAAQAISAGDIDDAHAILTELNATCRGRGMIGRLPLYNGALGAVEMLLGRFREADAALTDSLRLAREIGQTDLIDRIEAQMAILAAIDGQQDHCTQLATSKLDWSTWNFDSTNAAHARWALGLLDLGHGRYEAAMSHFDMAARDQDDALGCWVQLSSDRVEAAMRGGDPARAAEAMATIEDWYAANSAPWIEAHLLRCRGLLEHDETSFTCAMARHTEERRWYDHARTGLLYGEFLRRERSKAKARVMLVEANRTFERLGARPWAERARAELRAAGEVTDTLAGSAAAKLLTPQEMQVVRLAATGATNKEIGAQLMLSPKTVAHHLYRAFPKLGISSRRALAQASLDLDAPPAP